MIRTTNFVCTWVAWCCFFGGVASAQSFSELDTNQIAAGFSSDGSMFFDEMLSARFEVPKDSGRHAIFAAAPWIGGIDESGQLRVAAQTYRQTGIDYAAGPIAATYDSTYDQRYDRVWVVRADEIATHQAQYAQPAYTAPEAILSWPGNGDTTNGEPWQLAPFTDLDQDGVYEPADGETPAIEGDMAFYTLFNDARLPHTESGGEPLGVDVELMAYAYAPDANDPRPWRDEMIFLDYTVSSRDRLLDDFYFGLWLDWELGNFSDDYVGCDTTREAWYVYNGDSLDEGPSGYGLHPPAMGAVWLNQCLGTHIGYQNDFSATGNPELANHYYGYLFGFWKNGDPLSYGGNGFGNNTPTTFMYPDNPSDTSVSAWHEPNAGNVPSDRRGIGSIGPMTLTTEEPLHLQLALVYARTENGNHLNSVNKLLDRMDTVRSYFATTTCEVDTMNTSAKEPLQPLAWRVAPNPATSVLHLQPPPHATGAYSLKLLDAQGRTIQQRRLPMAQPLDLDIDHLPNGLYLLRIRSQSGAQVLRWRK